MLQLSDDEPRYGKLLYELWQPADGDLSQLRNRAAAGRQVLLQLWSQVVRKRARHLRRAVDTPHAARGVARRAAPIRPPELLLKLEAARARGGMVGERRVVTMLFCDIKGSTAAAEQLDPEEWAEIMNGAFEHLIAPVYRYEGTVARLMGDAILAFFGAPIAHEDNPARAVLTGLDIVHSVRSYRAQVKRHWGFEFDVRVGINTGLVVVGEVGSDLRMEYTAMGDAINLAARMEQTAQPGTVQITEATYRLVAPLFDIWEAGPIEIKGKTEPVLAYRVLERRAEPGWVRGIEGLEAPLAMLARLHLYNNERTKPTRFWRRLRSKRTWQSSPSRFSALSSPRS